MLTNSAIVVGVLAAMLAVRAQAQQDATAVVGLDVGWLAASRDSGIPENAEVSGEEPAKRYEKGSEPAKAYYVCRATVSGSTRVGKAEAGGVCELLGSADAERFEVLEHAGTLMWMPWRSDNGLPLPITRVIAGADAAAGVHVCRATSVCRFRKPNGVCTIEGCHPGTLSVGPDGIARCSISHRSFGDCVCHEFDVLTAATAEAP